MNSSASLSARGCVLLLVLIVFGGSCTRRNIDEFVTVRAPVIALTHIRVIDGTGSSGRDDQTIVIESGRISAIGPTSETPVPTSAKAIDLTGHTAIPGLVGMHDHLF